MPNSTTQLLLQSAYSEMLATATAVGELRARYHHVSHRLDLLEQRQSELALGVAAIKIPAKPDTTFLKHGRRYLPQILGWLGERLLPYVIPTLGIMWFWGRKIAQALLEWTIIGWHWLAALAG